MGIENPTENLNSILNNAMEKRGNNEEIADLKKYLKDRFELKDEDIEKGLEKIELVKLKDLPEHYKKQYEALKDQRLEGVRILIVPDNIWRKSPPSEFTAEQQLISFKESYFKNVDKPDEIAWAIHELAHCKRFLDSESPEEYQKDMQTFAFSDIKSEYPYPNNKIEEYTFTRQFEYLKNQGRAKEEISQMLEQYYKEADFLFFQKLLDKIYKKENKE